MDRATSLAIRQAQAADRTVADVLATHTNTAPIPEPTLPSNRTVPLVTLTTDELHDLIYAATSTYLRELSQMTGDRARRHATRVAERGQQIAYAQGYVGRGEPPRG